MIVTGIHRYKKTTAKQNRNLVDYHRGKKEKDKILGRFIEGISSVFKNCLIHQSFLLANTNAGP